MSGMGHLAIGRHPAPVLLEARNVSLVYTAGGIETYAVRDVSLGIREGEFTGLMGPSGSGKSSLLYILSGLKSPTAGGVIFDGVQYSALSRGRRCDLRQREFGFIFQQHFLVNYLTALENVLLAVPRPGKDDRRRAAELLEAMGLGEQIHKRPHQLSGGQRQRVAAARAIMHRPRVVFADEPTASLDHRTGLDLMARIEEYRREGGTMVVVTHDPSILARADRVFRIWDGEIVGHENGAEVAAAGARPEGGD